MSINNPSELFGETFGAKTCPQFIKKKLKEQSKQLRSKTAGIRVLKHNDPDLPPWDKIRARFIRRQINSAIKYPACWEWTGAISKGSRTKGTPVFQHTTKSGEIINWSVRQVMYAMCWGEAYSRLHLSVLCCNPKCVNPLHLAYTYELGHPGVRAVYELTYKYPTHKLLMEIPPQKWRALMQPTQEAA